MGALLALTSAGRHGIVDFADVTLSARALSVSCGVILLGDRAGARARARRPDHRAVAPAGRGRGAWPPP
ncbi:hypothetical protein ACWCPI_07725 [Streptomyces sp. NPDC001920]